jgi:hypothetical protein
MPDGAQENNGVVPLGDSGLFQQFVELPYLLEPVPTRA